MTASASPSRGQVCELEHLNVRLQPFPGSDALTWIGHVGIVLTNEREWGGVTTRLLSILLVGWKRSAGWWADTCAEAHFYISFLFCHKYDSSKCKKIKKVTLEIWNFAVPSPSKASTCCLKHHDGDPSVTGSWWPQDTFVRACLFPWRCHASVWKISWNASALAILPPQRDKCPSYKYSPSEAIIRTTGSSAYFRRKGESIKEIKID